MFHNWPVFTKPPIGFLVENRNLRQTLRPVVTVPHSFEDNLKGGYSVKYQAGTKQITLYRNLLASVLYEQGGVGVEEILVLYDLTQRLTEKLQKDRAFAEKYEEWLITTFGFIEKLNPQEFPFRFQGNVQESENLLKPYLPSRQAYFGWRRNPVRVTPASIRLRNPLTPPKRIPPKKFVGVGYTDKGNRRDPAYDGSPSWQQVATSAIMRAEESQPKQPTRLGKFLAKYNGEEET